MEAREAVRLVPNNMTYDNLTGRLLFTNRLEEAKVVFEEAKARGIDSLGLRSNRSLLALLQGDNAAMQEQFSWAMARPGTMEWALQVQSNNAIYHGRFRAARESFFAMHSFSPNSAADVEKWDIVAYTALADVEVGHAVQARQAAERALAAAPPSSSKRTLALVLARAGASNEAEKLADSISLESPLDTLVRQIPLRQQRRSVRSTRSRLRQRRPTESKEWPPLKFRRHGFNSRTRRSSRRSSCLPPLVVAHARMIIITRQQDIRVPPGLIVLGRNARWNAEARNLSAVVDHDCVRQMQVRSSRNQRIQIHHRTALFPQKRVLAHSDHHVRPIF